MRCQLARWGRIVPFVLFSLSVWPDNGHGAWLGPPPRLDLEERLEPEGATRRALRAPGVDTMSRYQVAQLFDDVYQSAIFVPMDWTGSLGACDAGSTSGAYVQATLDMVYYFRAMAGLPTDIAENLPHSAQAQQAALMMNAEGALSHHPGTGWACYSSDGAIAAGKSNLALGAAGPGAVALYIKDSGSSNYFVGHRRWILYPRQTEMGTGSTGGSQGFYHGANALWVLSGFGPRAASPEWVAWPPPGFVPYQVVYPRWSFSANVPPAEVDYASATVSMWQDGSPLPVTILDLRNDQGFGDDTLVWEPAAITMGQGMADQTIEVEIHDVFIDGAFADYSYEVTVIDPAITVCSAIESDLDLPYQSVGTAATFEACTSLAARNGFDITAPAEVTFRAPTVHLDGGFAVEKGARFCVHAEIP